MAKKRTRTLEQLERLYKCGTPDNYHETYYDILEYWWDCGNIKQFVEGVRAMKRRDRKDYYEHLLLLATDNESENSYQYFSMLQRLFRDDTL